MKFVFDNLIDSSTGKAIEIDADNIPANYEQIKRASSFAALKLKIVLSEHPEDSKAEFLQMLELLNEASEDLLKQANVIDELLKAAHA